MIQLSSKNDDSSLCYDVIIASKILKIDKFDDFRVISIITVVYIYTYVGMPAVSLRFVTLGSDVSRIHHPSAIGLGTSHHGVTDQRDKIKGGK